MAWTSVTYACGHTGSEQMFGPGRERDRKVEWYARSKLCPECYAKQLGEKREAARAAAAAKAGELDLAPLEGTEKQIAWAEIIRAKIVEANLEVLGRIADAEFREFAAARIQRLMGETKAHYWIDNRDNLQTTDNGVLGLWRKELDKRAGLAALKA